MGRYFASLEEQTNTNFEVIIIDDCSTDDSYNSLIDYKASTSLNLRVEKLNENGGPGVARNKGVEIAQGEWVTFIDNDDWVCPDFIESLSRIVANKPIGCVVFDYYTKSDKHATISRSMYYGEEGYVELKDAIISVRNHTFGKAYKLKSLRDENIYFPPLRTAEDMAFVPQALVACDNIYYLNKPLYYYYQRSNSISNKSKFGVGNTLKAYEILDMSIGGKYPKELKEKSVVDKLYCGVKTLCNEKYSTKDIKSYIIDYNTYNPDWWEAPILKHIGKAKRAFLYFVKARFILGVRFLSMLHRFMIRNQF
jgi:glycosyltransferase involved in cell wall biosynthesis